MAITIYAGNAIVGLSTDPKPTNIPNDARFYEKDTKLTYLKVDGSWVLFSGISGYSGQSGIQGINGVSGYSGRSGYSGYSGIQGINGISGYSGMSGQDGASGIENIVAMNSGGNITVDNFGDLITVDSSVLERTLNLPAGAPDYVGSKLKIVKLNKTKLNIKAAAANSINDSSLAGTVFNSQASETYAVIELQLISWNKWIIINAIGTWGTT